MPAMNQERPVMADALFNLDFDAGIGFSYIYLFISHFSP